MRWITPALITLDGHLLSRLYCDRSTPSIGLQASVGPPSMPWRSDSGKGRLALQALLEQARQTTWRLWAREAAIEFGQPKCWYRDVLDADKAAEAAWLGANVMGPGQAVWALRISARNRYSDRCWGWGERLGMPRGSAADRSGGRWSGVMKPDIVRA